MYTIDAEHGRLQLRCDLTIFQAAQLWPALAEALQQSALQEMDLGQVGEFDCAGLQLLLMCKRLAAAGGRNLQLINHSAAVAEALAVIKAEGLLGDPLLLPSQREVK